MHLLSGSVNLQCCIQAAHRHVFVMPGWLLRMTEVRQKISIGERMLISKFGVIYGGPFCMSLILVGIYYNF